MSETIKSIVGKISQETIMILTIGLTVLMTLFAGWSSLASQIEGLRTAMHEGDTRLSAAMHEGDTRLSTAMHEGDTRLLAAMHEGNARLLAAMHEGDARLRQERREDVAGLRGEIGDLRGEMADLRGEMRGEMANLRGEMGELRKELRTEVRAIGERIDRLTETVMLVVAEVKRGRQAEGGSDAPEDPEPEREHP